ncbi:MAG: hypothetical protein V3T72_16585 [Thermoanaerobaculia bacterium]
MKALARTRLILLLGVLTVSPSMSGAETVIARNLWTSAEATSASPFGVEL